MAGYTLKYLAIFFPLKNVKKIGWASEYAYN